MSELQTRPTIAANPSFTQALQKAHGEFLVAKKNLEFTLDRGYNITTILNNWPTYLAYVHSNIRAQDMLIRDLSSRQSSDLRS